jgi:hypothetical protein
VLSLEDSRKHLFSRITNRSTVKGIKLKHPRCLEKGILEHKSSRNMISRRSIILGWDSHPQ